MGGANKGMIGGHFPLFEPDIHDEFAEMPMK
jgi:hypothetical protein